MFFPDFPAPNPGMRCFISIFSEIPPPDPGDRAHRVKFCFGFQFYATNLFGITVVRHNFVWDSNCAAQICLGVQLCGTKLFKFPVVRHKFV